MNQEEQKEKYSAFISDVSEILGLGKPIDILKLCMITDRFFKPLQNQVKELEEQIEKMKCCGNCKHRYFIGDELECHLLDNGINCDNEDKMDLQSLSCFYE